MKKILITLTVFLVILFSANFAYAQEEMTNEALASTKSAAVDYNLPYPGLLPDSPLYIFKVARDRVIGFLISDFLKKANFNLLQADKRLNAGYYLFLKNVNKDKLVVSTLSKGESYFEKTLKEAYEAQKQGIDVNDFLAKAIISSQKHQQILTEIKSKISKENREGVEKELKRALSFEKLAKEIKPK